VVRVPPAHSTGRGLMRSPDDSAPRSKPPAMRRDRPLSAIEPGTLVLFVDGLRMDSARRRRAPGNVGTEASLGWRLSPVPSVTATAKALVTPVGDASLAGQGGGIPSA